MSEASYNLTKNKMQYILCHDLIGIYCKLYSTVQIFHFSQMWRYLVGIQLRQNLIKEANAQNVNIKLPYDYILIIVYCIKINGNDVQHEPI
jgi:hypothetical protein